MFAHAKALLSVMKEIDFPLFFPEESLTTSVIRHEELEQNLEQVTTVLRLALNDGHTLSHVRGEAVTGSGRKSLESRYIWERVFVLCDCLFHNISPTEKGLMFSAIAWVHASCDRPPPDPESVKKAFQRWTASASGGQKGGR
jgi:hypothetical protein